VPGRAARARTAAATRIDYQQAQFTNDAFVTGHITLDPGNALTGLVTVAGPGGRTGTLTIEAVSGTEPTA
jgi:hypothetical protein